MKEKNAIILCSGGLDSVVTSYYVKKKINYENIIILFFDYNQRTLLSERKFSKLCAKNINAKFIELKLPELNYLSNSIINSNKRAKKLNLKDLEDTKKESEKYYVPCRNLIFISYALALAESLFIKEKRSYDIFIGFKCEGKEPYPDTTIDFLNNINKISIKNCVKKFKVYAPLIKKDKEDIVLLGKKLNVDLKKTFSCYVDKKIHCGTCLACRLRQAGFYWAGIKDPTKYKEN
jgi:7-cyano-7-deazaguanine synthase